MLLKHPKLPDVLLGEKLKQENKGLRDGNSRLKETNVALYRRMRWNREEGS